MIELEQGRKMIDNVLVDISRALAKLWYRATNRVIHSWLFLIDGAFVRVTITIEKPPAEPVEDVTPAMKYEVAGVGDD